MSEYRVVIALLLLNLLSILLCIHIATQKYTYLMDIWPLENLLFSIVAYITFSSVIVYLAFRKIWCSLLTYILLIIFLALFVPLLKYPNPLFIYGTRDPLAHYSFTQWILKNGIVPSKGEVLYSFAYGNNPGNGIIPACVTLITDLPLGLSMEIVLFVIYFIYFGLSICFIKKIIKFRHRYSYLTFIFVSSIFLASVWIKPFYIGSVLGYAFTAILLFLVFSNVFLYNEGRKSYLLFTVTFLGLLLTHFSTATIMAAYLTICTTMLFVFTKMKNLLWAKLNTEVIDSAKFLRRVYSLSILSALTLLIYIGYELYVNVYLFRHNLKLAVHRLIESYIAEFKLIQVATEYKGMAMLDLLGYFTSQYSKPLLVTFMTAITFLTLTLRLVRTVKLHESVPLNSLLSIPLLLSALVVWSIGWLGEGLFLAGVRTIAILQFVTLSTFSLHILKDSMSILQRLERRKRMKHFLVGIFVFFILLGFGSNYGLPISYTISTKEGDKYIYPTWGQGALTPWVLYAVFYLNTYMAENSPSFLCVQPYILFGYCDLIWNKPKIPQNRYISLDITAPNRIIDTIKMYMTINEVLVPVPLNDRVLQGPIGYESFYKVPYQFLSLHCHSLLYHNGYYNTFFC
uniref:Glycosyltransferase RgtA/B/C/D-like domain-containing protein n=1 Tax=Ignisphaera aggregans TaxID=334771 RepID=A0A7J3YUW4_9CREN